MFEYKEPLLYPLLAVAHNYIKFIAITKEKLSCKRKQIDINDCK